MADLVVIVPSRGRPQAARELAQAFASYCTADTRLVFAVDEDDPALPEYSDLPRSWAGCSRPAVSVGIAEAPSTMVKTLNAAAASELRLDEPPFAIGFMGDDHRPRTAGWDQAYLDALRELGTGIVYGDDGLQGENLPTQVAMTSDIVRALGWMALPGLKHLFVDNVWKALGAAADCLRYLPDVLVEHMHPFAGKAEFDDGYARVNSAEIAGHDQDVYERWLRTDAAGDVAKIRALRPEVHEWRLFDEGTVPEHTRPGWYVGRGHAPHLEEGHRPRMEYAAAFIAEAAFSRGLRTVVDLGAGDGGLLSLLGPAFTAHGYDLMPENIRAAKERGVDVRFGDVLEDNIEWADIAVCTDMLEHLVDPHRFLRSLPDRVKVLVCSSPRDERPGAAYEFHTWAWDMDGYRALVEQAGFTVQRHRPVDRFQVILAVRP
jgi:SAM-dependent methyltransferase